MKSTLLPFCAALALAVGGALPAHADTVYKWVDQNGVTNYTTTPPLPNTARKTEAISAAPAMESRYAPLPGAEEGRYWRQRRELETADAIRDSRSRQEAADLQQSLLRQQIASSFQQEQLRAAEDKRRQAAFDQCMLDRRLDCANPGGGDGYGSGYVVAGNRRPGSIFQAAPFPVAGSPLVTNATPGAPSLNNFNNTPGAFNPGLVSSRPVSRPALERR